MAHDYVPKGLNRERERARPLLTEDEVRRIQAAVRRRELWEEEVPVDRSRYREAAAGLPNDVAVAEEREG